MSVTTVCEVCGGPHTEDHPGSFPDEAHAYASDCVAHVRATLQAEIDRLNARVAQAEKQADMISQRELDDALENQRLRKVIAGAPHEWKCRINRRCSIPEHDPSPCDCWKSRVEQSPATKETEMA